MTFRRASCLLSLSLLTLIAAGLRGQTPASAPSVDAILKKAIARAKWADEQKFEGKYRWTQHSIVEQLDSREQVKKREERLAQVYPVEGEPFARTVQKDGRAPTAKELEKEEENQRKFRKQLAEKRRKQARKKEDGDDVRFDEELIARFRFDLVGREAVNARAAYVLRFEPKSGDLPVRRKMDRLLNKIAGRLWIDEQDYEIARLDAHLAESVSAWGGLLASVRKFVVRFEQAKVDETAWLPHIVDGYIDGRILIKTLHVRVHQENADFHKATPDVAEKMQK